MSAAHSVEKHEATMADHESRIQSLETAVAVQSEQIKNSYVTLGEIKQMVADIRAEIAAIKGRSGKKWDSLEALTLAALVSGVVGYIIARVLV